MRAAGANRIGASASVAITLGCQNPSSDGGKGGTGGKKPVGRPASPAPQKTGGY